MNHHISVYYIILYQFNTPSAISININFEIPYQIPNTAMVVKLITIELNRIIGFIYLIY